MQPRIFQSIIALVLLALVVVIARFVHQQVTLNSPATMTEVPSTANLTPSLLSPQLEMGVVELNVASMSAQKEFYQDLVGLEVISESDTELLLGFSDRAVMRLLYRPDLKAAPPGSAGLYHTAIVFEARSTLAQALDRILTQAPARYSGTADHLVSEAFYFTDPENNGVELYFDKNPDMWQWRDGKVVMDSLYIDPYEYIRQYAPISSSPAKKTGHVHLKVGNIAQAQTFYQEILGFSLTSTMPTALFASDGFYHHHIGMNTWESLAAQPRNESLGLRSFEIFLPSSDQLEKLQQRLDSSALGYELTNAGLSVNDPWNNLLIFSVKPDVFPKSS
jgi:catechol 2,3-dioxygenase